MKRILKTILFILALLMALSVNVCAQTIPAANTKTSKLEQTSVRSSTSQTIFDQLKTKPYYKVNNNKLLISYDKGVTFINTNINVPKKNAYSDVYRIREDNIYVGNGKIAVVIFGTDFKVYVYVSDNKGRTWSKSVIMANQKDSFITKPTYVPKSGDIYSSAYIGFNSKQNGSIIFGGDIAMGNENNYVYSTTDGGKTWREIGNATDSYARGITGGGFSSPSTGFVCFRYDMTYHGPIYATYNGGKSWYEINIKYPSKYDNVRFSLLSPKFNGKYGILPISNSDWEDYEKIMFYLYTSDGGITWTCSNRTYEKPNNTNSKINLKHKCQSVFQGTIGSQEILMDIFRYGNNLMASYIKKNSAFENILTGVYTGNEVFLKSSDSQTILRGNVDTNGKFTGKLTINNKGTALVSLNMIYSTGGTLQNRYTLGNNLYLSNQKVETFVSNLERYVVSSDKESLAKVIKYPVNVKIDNKKVKINNSMEFIKDYDNIINKKFINDITNAYTKLMFNNYQGIMFGGNRYNFWIYPSRTGELKVITINN